MVWGLIAAGLLWSGQAAPASGAVETVQLKEELAVAYGGDGIPMFKADRTFILSLAANPDGRVFKVDSSRRRVRVSAEGIAEVWLACDELQPTGSCTAPAASRQRGSLSRGGGVPNCPGDPRCPKISSK